MAVQPDLNRLQSQLIVTGLQKKDNSLFQVISQLIKAVKQLQDATLQSLDDITNVVNTPVSKPIGEILGSLTDEGVREESYILLDRTQNPNLAGLFTNEVPSGAINGSNKTFTTAHNYVSGTLEVYLNGVRQEVTLDYTETGANTFDFVDAPLSGDTVLVDYGTIASALVGPTGATGPTGNTGPQGASSASMPPQDGEDGEQSYIPGPKGDIGPTGLTGSTGPQGLIGPALFPQDGLDGETFVIPGRDGKDGAVDSTAALTFRSTAQTIPNAIETAITFDNTLFDTASFWSAGSPTRLTVPSGKGGKYVIVGQVSLLITGSGAFDIHLYKNGTKIADNTYTQTNSDISLQVSAIADLVPTDYIELKVIINVGSSQATQGGSNETFLAMALCTGGGGGTTVTPSLSALTNSGDTPRPCNLSTQGTIDFCSMPNSTVPFQLAYNNGYPYIRKYGKIVKDFWWSEGDNVNQQVTLFTGVMLTGITITSGTSMGGYLLTNFTTHGACFKTDGTTGYGWILRLNGTTSVVTVKLGVRIFSAKANILVHMQDSSVADQQIDLDSTAGAGIEKEVTFTYNTSDADIPIIIMCTVKTNEGSNPHLGLLYCTVS